MIATDKIHSSTKRLMHFLHIISAIIIPWLNFWLYDDWDRIMIMDQRKRKAHQACAIYTAKHRHCALLMISACVSHRQTLSESSEVQFVRQRHPSLLLALPWTFDISVSILCLSAHAFFFFPFFSPAASFAVEPRLLQAIIRDRSWLSWWAEDWAYLSDNYLKHLAGHRTVLDQSIHILWQDVIGRE